MPDLTAWNRSVPENAPADTILYGPDVGTEAELRLLGTLADKRVIDLGCGSGLNSVTFARQGARTIAVDFSATELAAVRRRAEREGVRVEVHEGDLAELAFVRADSVDLVFSAYALQLVDDLSRVFRQVHRVLKQGCAFVLSLPHPALAMVDGSYPEPSEGPANPLVVHRSYFDRARIDLGSDSAPFFRHHHTIADLFGGLTRNNFRVDTILEPEPVGGSPTDAWGDTTRWVPRTLIMRARKEGI